MEKHIHSVPFYNAELVSIFQRHWKHSRGQRWTCRELIMRNSKVVEEALYLDSVGLGIHSSLFALPLLLLAVLFLVLRSLLFLKPC